MATTPSSTAGLSRRTFLGAGAGTAALGFLTMTGCASTSNGPAANGPLTVTSWVFGQDSGKALKTVVADFGTSTSIKTEENTYPYLQYLNQLVLKAKSKSLTGVAHIDEEWLSTLALTGALKEVSGIFDQSLYPDSVNNAGTYKGKRYAMPWTQSAIGVITNTEIFAHAGVSSQVRTTDEFTAALRALKRADSNLIPYAPCTKVEQLKDIIPWMWTFGSPVVDGETVTLGDDGSIQALDYWKLLLDEGLIQAGVVRDSARTLFAQGKAAIYDDAPQAVGIIPGQSKDPNIASKMKPVARPTKSVGDQPRALVWSQPLVRFSDEESTTKFMKFMSTDAKAAQKLFEAAGQPPTTKANLASDWFKNNTFHSEFDKQIAATATRNPFWNFPSASSAQTRFNEHVEAALSGTVTAKAAMAAAKTDLETMLKG
ncbi:ABC transporter substrate-binding protein (plasmid) [Paenarthrobacter ureafaciens]